MSCPPRPAHTHLLPPDEAEACQAEDQEAEQEVVPRPCHGWWWLAGTLSRTELGQPAWRMSSRKQAQGGQARQGGRAL